MTPSDVLFRQQSRRELRSLLMLLGNILEQRSLYSYYDSAYLSQMYATLLHIQGVSVKFALL